MLCRFYGETDEAVRGWSVRKMFAKLDLMEQLKPQQGGNDGTDMSKITEDQLRVLAATSGVKVRDRHGS